MTQEQSRKVDGRPSIQIYPGDWSLDVERGYIKIVNWKKFQHYKNRNPPWIKLYTELIDGEQWKYKKLSDFDKILLHSLWMLAPKHNNKIDYDLEWLDDRLHLKRKIKPQNLLALQAAGFITLTDSCLQPACNTLAPCKQHAIPEGETEGETETETEDIYTWFESFWKAYPRKIGKGKAREVWEKLSPSNELAEMMISAVKVQCVSEQWHKDNGQFIPYPATWINQERWEDELDIGAPDTKAADEDKKREKQTAEVIRMAESIVKDHVAPLSPINARQKVFEYANGSFDAQDALWGVYCRLTGCKEAVRVGSVGGE